MLRTSIALMKEQAFTLTKARSRWYPVQKIMDAEYADDIVFLANTPAQVEFLLNSLERAADGTGLHVNADKTGYMCFNQRGDVSTLNGRSLKLVDKFYLGSSVSSTENDFNTWLAKTWTAINRLSVIWKSDLSDKTQFFFMQQSCQSCYMDALHGRWLSAWRRSLMEISQECYAIYWTNPRCKIPQNSSCTATKHPSQKPSKLDEQDVHDTAREVRTNS